MWISSNKKRGFTVVIGHYINDSRTLKSRVMRYKKMKCTERESDSTKYPYYCYSQPYNQPLGLTIILDKLQGSSLILNESLLHMCCAAHILNLIIQDGLAVIGDGIEKVRDSVVYWTGSPKRKQKFEETTKQLHVACSKELILDLFSGTTYPTANMYFPKSMASRMLEKLDYYWKVINGIIGVAAVLDPRYKIKLLKWFYPKIYGVQAFEEIEKIRVICCNLLEEYNLKLMVKEARSSCVNSSSSRTENSQSTIKDSLSIFDLFVSSGSRASVNVKLELDHYIENGVSPRTTDFDILSRWRTNGLKYPTLQLIARDVLAILVSTMGSESAFSTSGRLLSPHHSRLHSKTLEALMCAQNWLWSEIKGSSPMSKDSTIQTILDDYDDHGEESVTAKLDE
ncbi:hypothetical protein ACSBR2_026865 [Camellia fascicularis]